MSTPPLAGGEDDRSVRWRLTLAYDGTGFHGFAAQEGQRTVAGELCGALTRITRTPVSLTCAGRTDAGVHALGQVVHFDLPPGASDRLDGDSLVKSCNSQLGPAIVVREAAIAPEGFDARHSATARRYRYLVVNAPVPDPLLARLAWQVADPLELRSMQAASDTLLGQHDFRAFCRRVPGTTADDPITRRVDQVRWSRWGGPSGPSGPPGWKGAERKVPGRSSRPWCRRWGACWPSRSRPGPSATRWSDPWWEPWWTWAGAGSGPRTCCGSSGPGTASRPPSRPRPTD